MLLQGVRALTTGRGRAPVGVARAAGARAQPALAKPGAELVAAGARCQRHAPVSVTLS